MFIFSAAWDEFPIALTMISSGSNYTLPVGLADFIGVHTVAWGPFLQLRSLRPYRSSSSSSSRFVGSAAECPRCHPLSQLLEPRRSHLSARVRTLTASSDEFPPHVSVTRT